MATRSLVRSSYVRPLTGLVLVVAILYLAKTVIVPLSLAILLTFGLTPVVSAIQRRGLPRIPAVLLTALRLLSGKVEKILQKGAYSREALLREVRKVVEL